MDSLLPCVLREESDMLCLPTRVDPFGGEPTTNFPLVLLGSCLSTLAAAALWVFCPRWAKRLWGRFFFVAVVFPLAGVAVLSDGRVVEEGSGFTCVDAFSLKLFWVFSS